MGGMEQWEEWRCMVGGVEVCERGGGVWEGWRCVGGMEVCVRCGDVCEV